MLFRSGGNGTGKTTTLNLIGRLRKPYRGKIFLKGKDLRQYKEEELYGPLLGILPQNPQCLFVKDTVEKDLWEMTGKHGDRQRMEAVIDQMEIRHLLKAHPYDLSGGFKGAGSRRPYACGEGKKGRELHD